MAFRLGEDDNHGINEINLIPLIDVMLVLMIIFLVTASVLNPTVPLNLPKTNASVSQMPAQVIQISIDKNANIFWDNQPISMTELQSRLESESAKGNNPQIQLRADKDSKYDTVAKVLAMASKAGLTKIAFVNQP